ncbi:MAG: PDZ domain-containing protein [Planctomycetota bacterium]|nr:MAG: PDZ domain-containing protein [Planctomycetota bacterium]
MSEQPPSEPTEDIVVPLGLPGAPGGTVTDALPRPHHGFHVEGIGRQVPVRVDQSRTDEDEHRNLPPALATPPAAYHRPSADRCRRPYSIRDGEVIRPIGLNAFRRLRLRPAPAALLSVLVAASAGVCRPAELRAQSGTPAASASERDYVVVESFQRVLRAVDRRAAPSVVAIARVTSGASHAIVAPDAASPPNPLDPDFVPDDFGTGVVIPGPAPQSIRVLTLYHVVRGGPTTRGRGPAATCRLYVYAAPRRAYEATIWAADPRSDLAVLTLHSTDGRGEAADLPPLTPDRAERLERGDFVAALTNPYAVARDGSPSLSWGTLGNLARAPATAVANAPAESEASETIHHFGTLWQIDTRLPLGSSGGAVLDLRGRLVGIATSMAALDGYERDTGFVIPFDEPARRAIATLIAGREVGYGFLGIALFPDRGGLFGLPLPRSESPGVRVRGVIPDSPADRAGLRDGDLIQRIDGVPVYDRRDLMREIGRHAPGSPVKLSISRPTSARPVEVTVKALGKWPVVDDTSIVTAVPNHPPQRGIVVDFPTARRRYNPVPLSRYPRAVVVVEVQPNSPAAAAKLRAGDFIVSVGGIPVETPEQFVTAFQRALQQSRSVPLRLLDGRLVQIPPP